MVSEMQYVKVCYKPLQEDIDAHGTIVSPELIERFHKTMKEFIEIQNELERLIDLKYEEYL